jgi:hypothetical protein
VVKVGTVTEVVLGNRPTRVLVDVEGGGVTSYYLSETVQMNMPRTLKVGHEVVVDNFHGLGLIVGVPFTGAHYVGDALTVEELFTLPHGSVVLGSYGLGLDACLMVEPFSDSDNMTVLNDGHRTIDSVDEVPSWLSYKLIWLGSDS